MIRKTISKLIVAAMIVTFMFSITACGDKGLNKKKSASDIKVGIILNGDKSDGDSYEYVDGLQKASYLLGVPLDQITYKYSVEESEVCYDVAAELADSGCNLIIAADKGFQSYIQKAAEEFPKVLFLAMEGYTAAQTDLSNFKNAYSDIYEARYISGIVAGMKLSELHKAEELPDSSYDENGNIKVGYIGTEASAEVISGYTAFLIGIRSVTNNVVMEVQYTNEDLGTDGDIAKKLIEDGCVIIGQHSSGKDIAIAVQEAYDNGSVCYSIGYNKDMSDVAPDVALTSVRTKWEVYYKYVMECMINGTDVAVDWSEGLKANAVEVTTFGEAVAVGTPEHVGAVVSAYKSDQFQIFDVNKFTVNGENIDSYYIDLNLDDVRDEDDENAQAIRDGYFHESEIRSAPYFDIIIDGVTELNY